jgi:hypothetical protein
MAASIHDFRRCWWCNPHIDWFIFQKEEPSHCLPILSRCAKTVEDILLFIRLVAARLEPLESQVRNTHADSCVHLVSSRSEGTLRYFQEPDGGCQVHAITLQGKGATFDLIVALSWCMMTRSVIFVQQSMSSGLYRSSLNQCHAWMCEYMWICDFIIRRNAMRRFKIWLA